LAGQARAQHRARRAVLSVVRDFVAEVDAHLAARLGDAKVQQLRELLQELGEAVAAGD
jgi:hypothetical protein